MSDLTELRGRYHRAEMSDEDVKDYVEALEAELERLQTGLPMLHLCDCNAAALAALPTATKGEDDGE